MKPLTLSLITLTSLIPGHHENHLILVYSSLMVPSASLRLLAPNHKDQPPPPDHLKDLLIWVDSIKRILLGFAQYDPWAPSRFKLILATLIIFPQIKVMLQLIICVHFTVCCPYRTLCIYPYLHSLCFILIFSRYLLSNYLVIDYLNLLLLLCIILILEMYSRYFDPGININIVSQ